jgi:DNA repair exonuclease SbcCD ATPase subunit
MLHSVSWPDGPLVVLGRGCTVLGPELAPLPAALGFGLLDAPSRLLPRSGQVEVQLASPLDGRPYAVSRALDVPEHWQIHDRETGWVAASGSMDVQRWLRSNLDLPDDLALSKLFRNVICISLPVIRSWLLAEPGRRERRIAELLRLDRYRSGPRWLDGVIAQGAANVGDLVAAARILEGRDQLLPGIRQRYEDDRAGSLQAGEDVARLQLALADAEAAAARHAGLQAELADVRRELETRRLAVAAAQAQIERWRHWLAVRDRAQKAALELQPEWQAYNEALADLGKLAPQLSSLETVRAELQAVSSDVLTLQREAVLVENQLALIRQAETAAGDLSESVHRQQQLEQQVGAAQERVVRLEQVTRALQATLADSKRVEIQLGEVERQLVELEQLESQPPRIKKMEQDLADQQAQLRDATRQVDHLHFLESATRALGGFIDDLRKGASVSERLAVQAGTGNGAQQRTISGHLREAIDHQLAALERQVRDWQAESRELTPAPLKVNQLRSSIHQLEQELTAIRKIELKLGSVPGLKLHRKQLRERFDELKKLTDGYVKEQHDCLDAPASVSQLRQELAGLNDPRSERLALLRQASRKEAVEADFRQVQRTLEERGERQAELQRQMDDLRTVQDQVAQLSLRRDETHEAYCQYLAQQATIELTTPAEPELQPALAALQDHQRLLQQAEAHETSLLSDGSQVEDAPRQVAALTAQVAEAELRAAEWKDRYQKSAEENSAAEENRAALRSRQSELDMHGRAQGLLRQARATVQEAERRLGAELRAELAAVAAANVKLLLDQDGLDLGWVYGEPPTLIRAGVSQPLDELAQFDLACCILSIALAIAQDASRLGVVILSGLNGLAAGETIQGRLPRLPDFDQFLLASA